MSVISDSVNIMRFLFSPFKKLIALYLISVIALSFLEVFRISLVYPIINYGLGVENQPKLLDAFYDFLLPSSMNPFVASALLLLVITVMIAGIYGTVAYGGSYVFSTVRDSLDRKVFERIKSRPYRYFAGKKQGDLLYIGQGAVLESSNAINQFVELLRNGFMSLFYLLLLFYLSFWLTICVMILGIFYAFIVKKSLFSRVYRNSSVLNISLMEKSVVYQEFISGIKTIFITGSLDYWSEKYDSAVKKLKKAYTNVYALGKIPIIANDFIMFSIIALGGILLYVFTGGDFIPYIGIFGTFMLALYRLVPSLSAAQSNLSLLVQYLPSLELVYGILIEDSDEEESSENGSDSKEFSFREKIEFDNVSFFYEEGKRKTLDNITFEISKNSRIAIVGSSGAGKTTVANLLALLYRPVSGSILIDGVSLSEICSSDYLSHLGYIGQETFVYHNTIRENIRFGQDCSEDDIMEAAKLADAHEFIMATNDGYDTVIGDQGLKLSGGQRQRIAIARIILRKPEILLLDEATSSLDNISEQKIMESVEKLSKNMTVIIIAHRLSTVQNADQIFVLKGGKLVERGSHNELMELRGEYQRLYLGQKKDGFVETSSLEKE
ncbi:ABC transporter ATP-binding protein/permease [Methanomicrobium antiquum]|uniref:ABC transporter ATP-binding protein/permease n=1 Tax=Methanomicrobium antiquum TaxID=487686 RepID=A0AAF0FVD3_9EURY|nr:ABC transporter ATP-binding protein [Methanomicrobium antiquum]WFN37118.1 ABC transporter ATP-binding protein/permease [Methanomicrobium antiquum]